MPVVLNALSSLSCALDILRILCTTCESTLYPVLRTYQSIAASNEAFRQGVLEAEPLLLETLLRQSIDTDRGFDRVSHYELL